MASLGAFAVMGTAELAVMMRAMAVVPVHAMMRAVFVLSVLVESKGRMAFFHIRCLLFDFVVVIQSLLLGGGIFCFRCGKSGTCQQGSHYACND